MKKIKIRTINWVYIILLITCKVDDTFADVGCLYSGDTMYPNSTGTNNTTGNILYYNTGSFARRTYPADPNCGILSADLVAVSPYTPCDVMGVGNYGALYTFSPSDNTCQAPIDDSVPFFIVLMSSLGVFFIFKNK